MDVSDTLEGSGLRRMAGRRFVFDGGRIDAIEPAPSPAPQRLAMPGLVNAHDHARPLSPTSFGGAAKPLETWLLRTAVMPAIDPWLGAVAAFGRAARSGCVSIMAHYTRWHGPMPAPDEAALVAKAANDIGVRVTFAPALRDRNPLVYGASDTVLSALPDGARNEVERTFGRAPLPVREQIALVEACAAMAEGPLFNVQFGPAGVQWCSPELLGAIAEASAATGRRVHMHLLETKYQRAFADAHYPQGVVRMLRDIALLSPRLTLAHCVYARPDELEMIAESGATIVTNASSNLHLRSGVAPIGEALRRGCRVAIGIDASALDEDDDALREMRLAHYLHGGWGFDANASRETFLAAIVSNGRNANGAPGDGMLAAGNAADMIVLNLDSLDRDAIMPVAPLDYLFARANASHVSEVIVAGETIVREGRLVRVDLDEIHMQLRAQYRAGMKGRQPFVDAFAHLEPAIAAHFRAMPGCG